MGQVNEARSHGYRIHGHYLGTYAPEVNIHRIAQRTRDRTGHQVDPELIPTRWRYSLSNLRRTVELFDELTIYDNSEEYDLGCQDPSRLAFFQSGRVINLISNEMRPEWFKDWYAGWEHRRMALERQQRKERKGRDLQRD